MKITRVKTEDVAFLKQRKEVRELIDALNDLNEGETGVVVEFDDDANAKSVIASLRNYDKSITTRKLNYGVADDFRYIIYYEDHVIENLRGSDEQE